MGVSRKKVNEHLAALATLKDNIPGITELTFGENFTERADGYTHGLVVVLEAKAALEVYMTHPRHIEAATPLLEDAHLLVMDYEF